MDFFTTGTTGPTGPTGSTGILPIGVACGGVGQPKCTMFWWQIAVYGLIGIIAIILIALGTYYAVGYMMTTRSRHSVAHSSYSGNTCSGGASYNNYW